MHIYLVSNVPLLTLVLRDFLTGLGHEVVSDVPLAELPNWLEQSAAPVGLVLLALPTEPEDLRRVIWQVHQRYPDLLLLLMGDQLSLVPEEAIALGVCGYLRFPLRLSELEFALRRLAKECAGCRVLEPKIGAAEKERPSS
jgi:DNA-binding NarL/FixJ family response regulator